MVLIRGFLIALLIVAASGLSPSVPASAHEKHKEATEQASRHAQASQGASGAPSLPSSPPPTAMHEQMQAQMEAMEDEPPKTFAGRLMRWFGRMHPLAVHFPIALFPVALVALILARKRGEKVALIRALIIVAGAGAMVAAALGWLNAGVTVNDTDTLLMFHRWLGTALGLIGAAMGWWAWRRHDSVHGSQMVAVLGVIVALLLVQGFLGASLTHGIEHMMF